MSRANHADIEILGSYPTAERAAPDVFACATGCDP
jgi:hypothetical protein